jgi:hypothetical protein
VVGAQALYTHTSLLAYWSFHGTGGTTLMA